MFNCECFSIDISLQKSKPLIEKDKKTVFRFSPSRWWSMFSPSIMKADPFLFVHNDTLHLFYEEMPIGNGLGVLKKVSTKDLTHWSTPVQITHEPKTHFSYPWVFEHEGNIFMLPETGCDHNLRLYKAVNDELTEFESYKVILERPKSLRDDIKFDYADSCIYIKEGIYYLFSSYYDGEQYFLELYTSDALEGTYVLHPSSPICIGNKYGRCAGSLIENEGKLYRPTQDCMSVYGGQVHLMEIDELTPTKYREHVVQDNLLPTDMSLYKQGGHQLNFAEFMGKTVVATDYRYICQFTLERLRLKILKLLHLKENTPY